jgi:hypothetical protein
MSFQNTCSLVSRCRGRISNTKAGEKLGLVVPGGGSGVGDFSPSIKNWIPVILVNLFHMLWIFPLSATMRR